MLNLQGSIADTIEAVSGTRARPSRRTFLAATGAAVAVPMPAAGYAFFTLTEAKLMEAVCEQILPSDTLPGAREAGVVRYIDRQLKGPLARYSWAYRAALAGLSAAKFLTLSLAERTQALDEAEAGRLAGVSAAAFRMIVDHTMQGFLGDPSHGGNAERVGWKLLGYHEGGHGH